MIRVTQVESLRRYASSASTSPNVALPARPFTSEKSGLTADVDAVFRIVTSSSSDIDLKQTLADSKIFLSSDLIDRVLKRFRFSHVNPMKALDFFNYTGRRRGFYHTSFSLDTMLFMLGRNRRFDHIWNILVETRRKDPNLITPRTVQVTLARIAKVCSIQETVESFKKFRKLVPLQFDTDYFNALLRSLCQERSMVDARNVYHGLKKDFRPNLRTFNILLSGWKSSEDAEAFFEEMRDMGVKPDVVSYNCLIDIYCKDRKLESAYKVFENMRGEGISPDHFSYTSIIVGLGLVGQPEKARDVLREMKENGCYPDVAAHNAVIRNFCVAKRFDDAYSVMEEMESKGLSPSPTTYHQFFRCYHCANDLRKSWDLYRRMMDAQCFPNTQSCMFLISLCKRQENSEIALQLWDDMIAKGFGSYALVSDVLFDLLCDLGRLAEAEKCFLQMLDKGLNPSSGSFKRIKVLMELANKHEALENLLEKMNADPV